LDAASIAWSATELWNNPSWANLGFLVWDVVATAIPYAPGSYVAKTGRLLGKADDVVDALVLPPSGTESGETWYSEAAEWAVSKGLTDGANLEADVTREQVATILYRYNGIMNEELIIRNSYLEKFADSAEVSEWALDAMTWVVRSGFIAGRTPTTIVPQGAATRAEVATLLTRFVSSISN
jgi:hypothetical protein